MSPFSLVSDIWLDGSVGDELFGDFLEFDVWETLADILCVLPYGSSEFDTNTGFFIT